MLLRNKRSSDDVSESKGETNYDKRNKKWKKDTVVQVRNWKTNWHNQRKRGQYSTKRKYAEFLSELFEKGIIYVDGKFINSDTQ